jgi:transcriptional regulator with XRE-family HTH domain
VSTRVGLSVRQRRAAAELKRLRELALLTADEVAQRLGWSASKVSRVENARIRLKTDDVRLLLGLYEVTGEHRDTLLALVEEDGHKKWWEAYADVLPEELLTFISFEAEASAISIYDPVVVPGLLQTEAYARRVIHMWQSVTSAPPVDLERRLEVRLTRQRIISSSDPPRLEVVIDEGVLRRQIDERAVMWEQLHHLADVSERPNVKLQILPLSDALLVSGPQISLGIPDFGDVVYIENFLSAQLFIEDAASIFRSSLIFKSLGEVALPVGDSRDLIRRTANELWAPAV